LKNTKVIHLGQTRELLAEWNEVRVAILAGRITGFHAGVETPAGTTVYLAGSFQDDPMQAVRSLLRAAADSTKRIASCVPAFRTSRM
jgi:hypothetical protein